MINKQANIKGQEFLLEAWRREGGHQSAGVGAGETQGKGFTCLRGLLGEQRGAGRGRGEWRKGARNREQNVQSHAAIRE